MLECIKILLSEIKILSIVHKVESLFKMFLIKYLLYLILQEIKITQEKNVHLQCHKRTERKRKYRKLWGYELKNMNEAQKKLTKYKEKTLLIKSQFYYIDTLIILLRAYQTLLVPSTGIPWLFDLLVSLDENGWALEDCIRLLCIHFS